MAYAELHWSPDTFWKSTLRELMCGWVRLLPAPAESDVNTPESFFNQEELAVFDQIKADIERDKRLKNSG